jgi:hypothetical protein
MTKRLRLLLVLVGAFALASPVLAQSTNDTKPTASPLVRLLQSKGILTDAEVAMVSQASSANEADARLAKLLLSKGLISQDDYNQTVGASMQEVAADSSSGARMVPAVLRLPIGASPNAAERPAAAPASNASSSGVSAASKMADILPGGTETTTDIAFGTIQPAPAAPEPAAAPPVIPAFAPIRVLPVGLLTRESVKPVISAGPIRIQPYGFFKMNVIEDSSNPFSGDAIISGMLGENPIAGGNLGPNPNPQFHLNARASRFGANFEWLDPSEKLVVTGKLEGDFEGNFTTVFNRGIASVRSSNFGIRLAFGRLDYHASDHSGIFAEFGQDWTPFCSSTLPSSNETTLLGVGFGSCYERDMQARFGVNYDFGGDRHFQLQPEFALAFPALGNTTQPSQLSIGERSGADSNRPEYQSRIALQFQLDKAPAVPPAQLIVSGVYGKAKLLVASTAVPANFAADFPGGATTTFRTFGYSAEAQLPTRWFTLQGKWWAGEALRWFFVDNLFNSFNSTVGFPGPAGTAPYTATAGSISGEGAAVAFGCTVATAPCPAGNAVVLPQSPVRGVGGFGDLGIPLSRIFGANPTGRNAGWTLDIGYNFDQSKARDLRQLFGATGGRYKNDWGRVTLNYKLNSWVLIGFEEGYYRTRILPGPCAPACSATNPFGSPLIINGVGVRSWHDLHEQISTVFFF